MDLPSEFWNPILIRILSQKKFHRHWLHVIKKGWLLGCEIPAHHFTNIIGRKSYLQNYRKRNNASRHREYTNCSISTQQTTAQHCGTRNQKETGIWLSTISLTTFSLEFSDLKIWYDKIVHPEDSLDLKFLGIPLPSIIRMLDTIQHIYQKVRTAYGNSNLTYGVDTNPNSSDTSWWEYSKEMVVHPISGQSEFL